MTTDQLISNYLANGCSVTKCPTNRAANSHSWPIDRHPSSIHHAGRVKSNMTKASDPQTTYK